MITPDEARQIVDNPDRLKSLVSRVNRGRVKVGLSILNEDVVKKEYELAINAIESNQEFIDYAGTKDFDQEKLDKKKFKAQQASKELREHQRRFGL